MVNNLKGGWCRGWDDGERSGTVPYSMYLQCCTAQFNTYSHLHTIHTTHHSKSLLDGRPPPLLLHKESKTYVPKNQFLWGSVRIRIPITEFTFIYLVFIGGCGSVTAPLRGADDMISQDYHALLVGLFLHI